MTRFRGGHPVGMTAARKAAGIHRKTRTGWPVEPVAPALEECWGLMTNRERAMAGPQSVISVCGSLARSTEQISSGPVFDLAAAYVVGTARGHPFVDGNGRVACAAAALFSMPPDLGTTASEVGIETSRALADRGVDETGSALGLQADREVAGGAGS